MTTISYRLEEKDPQNLPKVVGKLVSEPGSLSSGEGEQVIRKQQAKERRRLEKELNGKNVGHWNLREKRLYYTFLTQHERHFIKNELRRSDKVFRSMSHFIGTRAADQCRSHHQKMEKKYKTFENIVQAHKTDLEELAQKETLKPSEPTLQSLSCCELFAHDPVTPIHTYNQIKTLFELPSLLMETPISLDKHFIHDIDQWPLRGASDYLD